MNGVMKAVIAAAAAAGSSSESSTSNDIYEASIDALEILA